MLAGKFLRSLFEAHEKGSVNDGGKYIYNRSGPGNRHIFSRDEVEGGASHVSNKSIRRSAPVPRMKLCQKALAWDNRIHAKQWWSVETVFKKIPVLFNRW